MWMAILLKQVMAVYSKDNNIDEVRVKTVMTITLECPNFGTKWRYRFQVRTAGQRNVAASRYVHERGGGASFVYAAIAVVEVL